jgi:hypothetical protein
VVEIAKESFRDILEYNMTTNAPLLQVGRHTRNRPAILGRLQDWQYLERSIQRILCGWGRRFSGWEDKSALHRHVWEQAEIVQKFRDRIAAFPGGDPDAAVSAKLERLANAVLLAPSFEDAVSGVYEILARAVAKAYVGYAQAAHPVHDAPTVRMLHDVCMLKEQQWLWLRDYRRRHPHAVDAAYQRGIEEAWAACGALAEALPVDGDAAQPAGVRTDFRLPRFIAREYPGTMRHDFMPYVRADFSTNVETRRLFWAYGYMMEKGLPDDQLRWIYWGHFMPWDFQRDVSRHLWDESRHGDSGWSRLKDFGISFEEVGCPGYDAKAPEGVLSPEEAGEPLSPRALYDEVFFIGMVAEQGHFIVKNQGYQDFRDGDDLESAEMMLFDIIDETQHVQYAHRWLPVLAEHAGVDNSDYKERAAAKRKECQEEELARIAQDKLAPRTPGSPAWELYQDLLARIRARCPLTNAATAPERSPKPM